MRRIAAGRGGVGTRQGPAVHLRARPAWADSGGAVGAIVMRAEGFVAEVGLGDQR